MTAYRDAAATKEQSEQQISNLTSAFGYADSYANMQEFYSAHQGAVGEKERFENVITSYSKDTTNLVTGIGEVYRATTGADTDGNTVFGYANSDGEKQYMSKEVIYTDGTNSYRKNKSGEYIDISDENKKFDGDTSTLKESSTNYYSVTEKMEYEFTDEDGNKASYTVTKSMIPDGEGGTKAQYSFEKDGKTYISDKETGEYKNADQEDDKISVSSLKYSYEKGTQIFGVDSVENAYKKYAEDYTISEEQAQSLKTDINKVNTFEKQANDGTSLTYSKENIKDEIQKAYESNGRAGINDLVEQFSEAISTNRTDADKAQETMDANNMVKDLAGLKDGTTELASALDAMVNNVLAAVEVLNDPTKYSGGATKMNGQDAVIVLDGVTYENATNGIEINGMTINALAATGDGDENAITITTATDTQGIYDKIKDFLTEYNNIINEMSKLYNAASSKGYDPLTDEEKDAMSDKEVEKWETKIKDSILRRDSTLGGIMNTMVNAMAKGFSINGKNYSLSSFGIKTSGYLNAAKNENYAYHIDGDEDDANTSGNSDKLMAMINAEPETVMSFFEQLTTNLYEELGKKMRSTSLSSSYTIYNDKQMSKQYNDYTKLIKDWENRITEKEDYYNKKFTAMETALAKLNSTQSSLSGYMS